jgi:hypothetical protein
MPQQQYNCLATCSARWPKSGFMQVSGLLLYLGPQNMGQQADAQCIA